MRMNNLALQALEMAAQVRRTAGIEGAAPLCVYDLVERCFGDEIDLRFQPLNSLEGMYSRQRDGSGIIIVSSVRPGGRRRYTCAHELGHHLFKHRVSLDELVEEHRGKHADSRELLVDLFAGYLLMPKLGVLRAARERDIDLTNPSAKDVYTLACYFGVGYTTLLTHATRSIRILPTYAAQRLERVSPQSIRESVLGKSTPGELIIVDTAWGSFRPIDAVVGDHVVLPPGATVEGTVLVREGKTVAGDVYVAVTPGVGRTEVEGSWSAFVRVERANYRGMGRFRNLEECDDE
ncbi:ImmA/IrrE family metallo-endopeptidase [Sorangium sp. So ce1389]|uniref:ImmA/IrrE family metallo-endopeptidase n=1 Tax=Sorangium sp. So ce1389 TaxID=3133336 RepID=UPI003F644785